ncbi:Uncharacterised protein [Collinsella aerofaciens]|uniref:Uncharacterized protein n=1 Tax=Collinsella aerofaciens TaxID=74426 RepID=A0A5K1JB34_9ACTN|nr:hypothetical protein [Collinsella aerofaciens]VWM00831.1 Uncharacterised protein [Collinsella aerofaciens]
MSTMQTRLDDAHKWIESHRAQALAVLVLLAAIVLIIGLSLSWFVGSKSLSTVGKIQTPAQLKVLGPNQTTIEPIEISYDESRGDAKNADGTVTVRRAFCVQSDNDDDPGAGQAFELQVANTTNITGLTINVYRVKVNDPSAPRGDVVGLDGLNRTYSWSKKGTPIAFTFINSADGTGALAKELEVNDPTFGTYKSVQKNARPLYRYHTFQKADLDGWNGTKANAATNFIIECTWNPGVVTAGSTKVSNVKETDMVYLIARGTNAN